MMVSDYACMYYTRHCSHELLTIYETTVSTVAAWHATHTAKMCLNVITYTVCFTVDKLTGDQQYFLTYQFLLRIVLSRCSDRSAV